MIQLLPDHLIADEVHQRLVLEARARERRERIATAALTGILTNFMPGTGWQQSAALRAVAAADALIAELDKQP